MNVCILAKLKYVTCRISIQNLWLKILWNYHPYVFTVWFLHMAKSDNDFYDKGLIYSTGMKKATDYLNTSNNSHR